MTSFAESRTVVIFEQRLLETPKLYEALLRRIIHWFSCLALQIWSEAELDWRQMTAMEPPTPKAPKRIQSQQDLRRHLARQL